MMKDFTLSLYRQLLNVFLEKEFHFKTLSDPVSDFLDKSIALRQDVDKLPWNSLEFALIQAELGIRSTFYFRSVIQSFDESVIRKIANMGHEIGYHYEELGTTAQQHKGILEGREEVYEKRLVDIAIAKFKENLECFRKIVPINTICMHGNPLSRWDSRLLWKFYDYHDFGIIWEPYFDMDFNSTLYLTDTGRRWNGDFVSVRDKAQSSGPRTQGEEPYVHWKVQPVKGSLMNMTTQGIGYQNRYRYGSTDDIIKAVQEESLPGRIVMTFHPQRWTDKPLPWMKELILQNAKNMVKYFLIRANKDYKFILF